MLIIEVVKRSYMIAHLLTILVRRLATHPHMTLIRIRSIVVPKSFAGCVLAIGIKILASLFFLPVLLYVCM